MNSVIRVIAFEPVPEIYERLVTNVATNAFQDRCQPVQKAVSDVPGIARLLIPLGEIPTEASLDLQNKSARKSGTLIDIESTTLDTLFGQETVDFIKIDVEGAEHKVLQGARQLLARCRPTILLEHHANCPPHAIESVLKPYGYLFLSCLRGWSSRPGRALAARNTRALFMLVFGTGGRARLRSRSAKSIVEFSLRQESRF